MFNMTLECRAMYIYILILEREWLDSNLFVLINSNQLEVVCFELFITALKECTDRITRPK